MNVPKFLRPKDDERFKDDLRKLSDDSLVKIQNLCGDDFRLWDICKDILEERMPIPEVDE
jgi:hypothetical protein